MNKSCSFSINFQLSHYLTSTRVRFFHDHVLDFGSTFQRGTLVVPVAAMVAVVEVPAGAAYMFPLPPPVAEAAEVSIGKEVMAVVVGEYLEEQCRRAEGGDLAEAEEQSVLDPKVASRRPNFALLVVV